MADAAEHHRRCAAKRKAERVAARAELALPICQQCGEVIMVAVRTSPGGWVRRYCSDACRQAAWRTRRGE
jgi:hypothetical protein